MVGLIILAAFFQGAVIYAITYTFQFSIAAGLNIGIAQAIWAVNPFFTALIDYLFYGNDLESFHILGMLGIVTCTVLVSLSQLVNGDDEDASSAIESSFPVYGAILFSFSMPLVCLGCVFVIKKATSDLKVAGNDFSNAFMLVMSLVYMVVGIISFTQNPGTFDLTYGVYGFFGSILTLLGSICASNAIGTGSPVGPIQALISS
jgi:drug/metabolite transporter (DMT)-like permease